MVMQHGKATLENHLAVSYKTKHTPKHLANHSWEYYGDEISIPFVHILQTPGTSTYPSASECMHELWCIHTVAYSSAVLPCPNFSLFSLLPHFDLLPTPLSRLLLNYKKLTSELKCSCLHLWVTISTEPVRYFALCT